MNMQNEILRLLGCGLSVNTLCSKLNISYSSLCKAAAESMTLYNELKKWYPAYDFTVKPEPKEDPIPEVEEIKENPVITVEVQEIQVEPVDPVEPIIEKPKKTRKKKAK